MGEDIEADELKEVYVLRLHHRPERDKRVTTHVILTARAFGAKGVYLHIEGEDPHILDTIRKVVENWGGKYFFVEVVKNPVSFVRKWKEEGGIVVHLTMYGLNVDDVIGEIPTNNKTLVIVGSEKVEGIFYELADFNVAVGNQPHSEVAALAIFLDRVYKGKELTLTFKDARIKIIPEKKGKKVISVEREGKNVP